MRSLRTVTSVCLSLLLGITEIVAFSTFTSPVRATDSSLIAPIEVPTSNGGHTTPYIISTLFNHILTILLTLGGIVAVFYLMWAGIQYITAGGDAAKAKAARAAIINAIVGIVIIGAAFLIINFAQAIGRFVANIFGNP